MSEGAPDGSHRFIQLMTYGYLREYASYNKNFGIERYTKNL